MTRTVSEFGRSRIGLPSFSFWNQTENPETTLSKSFQTNSLRCAKGEEVDNMQRQNITGHGIACIRSQQNMSQEILAARLHYLGPHISRKMLAIIEIGRSKVEDEMLPYFQQALQVPIVRFFPPEARFAACTAPLQNRHQDWQVML
jgi:hypothetical protein